MDLTRAVKGCKVSVKYTNYFKKSNGLYFNGELPSVKVYTAPLLKITAHGQKEVLYNKDLWADAGYYGLVGMEDDGSWCIIVDRGTSVYHSILTKQTILHEMIHIKLTPYGGHGVKFKKQIRRIAALGALDTLI